MCNFYLGFDTSNYTTSAALVDSRRTFISERMILNIKQGERGIRQSDAVFHHTNQMPKVLESLFSSFDKKIDAVGCSVRPCDSEKSYMPCFLVGKNTAFAVSRAMNLPYYEFSHQVGHIAAALFSIDRFDLFEKKFLAFHVSGGTTQALLVEPSGEKIIKTKLIASTLDLNAGQLVDRVGVMLGLKFPCGAELEKLALNSERNFKINVKLKGFDCCLSGIENQCIKMMNENQKKEDIALFCIENIKAVIFEMTKSLLNEYKNYEVVYAGGVMSNSLIKNYLSKTTGGNFAKRELSTDNSVGIAVLTGMKFNR